MFIKNRIILLFVCFIGLFNTILCDDLTKFFELKKLGSLYPDNSFSMVQNDELNISKINGSVLFSLPISQSSMNGYPLSVTLNYSGGISTTSYAFCKYDGGGKGQWSKMHQNRPAWILGVNGIAIQVFAGNAMFTCDPDYQLEKWIIASQQNDFTITNKDVTWMIDGYDVCNELFPFGADNTQDVIKILKSDGSLLEFRNQFPCNVENLWIDRKYYTGKYYINEVNSKSYAIVDFDWSQKNLADEYLIKSGIFGGLTLDSIDKLYFQPRLLKYYPGDGYEYVFKEYKMPYGVKSYAYRDSSGKLDGNSSYHTKSFGYCFADINNSYTNLLQGPLSHPNIFYLFEIKNTVKPMVTFNYAKHITPQISYFDDPEFGLIISDIKDSTLGRAAIVSFDNHEVSFSSDYCRINAFDKKFLISVDSAVHNGYYVRYPVRSNKLLMESNKDITYALKLSDDPLNSQHLYYSAMGYVTEIESEGIHYKFGYEDYNKNYKNYKFPTENARFCNITLSNKRLKKIESFNKKVELSYVPSNYMHPQSPLDFETSPTDYDEAFRYLNNVVDSVTYFSKEPGTEPFSDNWYKEKKEIYEHNIYKFPNNNISLIKSENYTIDYNTNKSYCSKTNYNQYQIDPILFYSNSYNPSPFVYHTNIKDTKIFDEKVDNDTIVTSIIYKNYNNNSYLIVDSLNWSGVKGKSGEVMNKSKIVREYEYGNSEPDKIVFDNTLLNDSIGFLLISDTTKVFHPNDTIQSIIVNNYSNFPIDSIETNVIEKKNDKNAVQSFYETKITEGDDYIIGKNFKELYCYLMQIETDTVASSIFYSNYLFGVLKNTKQYNRFGEIINGKSNFLMNTIIVDGKPLFAIGKVKSDTILGNNGVSKLGNFYDYSYAVDTDFDGLTITNSTGMLTKVKNNLGVLSKMFYNYDEWTDELNETASNCSHELYGGQKLFFKNYTKFKEIQLDLNYDLNSVPLINTSDVRKFSLDLNRNIYLDTIQLVEYKSKNRLGNITQSVDLNGWLSEFKYDKHGRMKMAWLPGDFPDTLSLLDYADSLDSPGISRTTGIIQYRRIGCKIVNGIRNDWNYALDPTTGFYNKIRVSTIRETTPRFYCPCGPIDQGIINPKDENDEAIAGKNKFRDVKDLPEFQTIDSLSIDSCSESKDFLLFDSSEVDIDFFRPTMTKTVVTLDSVVINIFITGLISPTQEYENMTLAIKTNLIYRNRFLGKFHLVDPSSVEQDIANGGHYFTIKFFDNELLSQIIDKFNNDLPLSLHFEVLTDNQGIEFGEIFMKSYGTFLLPQREDTDYTLKADYSDEKNAVLKNQKIDDNLHSYNDYELQYENFGFRRLESLLFFKNNKIYASQRGFDPSSNVFYYDVFGRLINQYDPLNFMDSLEYDLAGNVSKFINKDNNIKTTKVEYGKPLQDFGITEHSFNDFCKKVRSTDEIGNAVDMYFDGFDKLILKIEDPDTLRIATKYEYDKFDRLKYVIDAKYDTTKYWYDDFGNIKYKYHPDLGYTSYRHDDFGNLRFSQDQNQADSAKLSFFEYDDLTRLMISGEAKLLAPHLSVEPISNEIHENYVFGRFTDIIEPNELQNGQTDILTLNSTLWTETLLDTNYCDRKLELDSIHPLSVYPINYWKVNHILDDTTIVPLPMIYHVSNMTDDVITYNDESWKEAFENFNYRPKNVLNAYYYDDFPPNIGPVWRYIQNKNIWDALSPKGMLRNTKGKISAMAYRESGKQEFNYMVFSYDERGRIEALLRFTENLGFDGIYYQYNSANLVINTCVIDPVRQFNTWYGYDGAGRVDTVWSKIEDGGFHFDNSTWSNAPSKPVVHNKSISRDFNYSYTKRDQVDSIFYPNNLSENFTYLPRGWQQKQDLVYGSNLYLNSYKSYIDNGLLASILENTTSPLMKQKVNVYAYDNRNQLRNWDLHTIGYPTTPVMSENYTYDSLGNRTFKSKSVNNGHTDYFYNDPNGPNRLTEYYSKMNIFQFESRVFQQFHSDGALYEKCIYSPQSVIGTLCAYEVKKEEFFYNYLNLTNKYIFMQGEACSTDMAYYFDYPKTEWRYRFNPFGEREQKRMYQSPLGDTGNEMYPWVYYLLGIDNKQYATYYGIQSSDNSVLMNDYTYVAKPDPYKPVTFYYPVEYNVYGNEQAPKMTYKYVNGQWQKQYKIYDYLGSLRYTMSGTGQVLNYKTYEPYGGTMLDTLGVTRQNYIGKEKDVESSLGDHGVRKYDYETGRFNSVDPLFEKFFGWNPYQYCFNNPVRFYDGNGLLPGDPFESEADAKHDFGKNYIEKTKVKNAEYGTIVYSYLENGETKYSYMVPEKGSETQVTHALQAPKGTKIESEIHTHNSNNIHSKSKDIKTADTQKIQVNVVTQNGQIWNYDPNTKKIKQTHSNVDKAEKDKRPIPEVDEVDNETQKLKTK